MSIIIAIILVIILFVLPIIVIYYSYKMEKEEWNNGICKESGKPWFLFCEDHKSRCYMDGGYNVCTITFKDIDKNIIGDDDELV